MITKLIVPGEGSPGSCKIIKWNYKVGDKIRFADPVCEVETDKTVFEVESPVSDTLLKILYDEGQEVPIGQPIALIGDENDSIEDEKTESPRQKSEEEENRAVKADANKEKEDKPSGEVLASPRARRLAKKKGASLDEISSVLNKAIIKEDDVFEYLKGNSIKKEADDNSGVYEILPQSAIRNATARKMYESLSGTAQYTLHTRAEIGKCLEIKDRLKVRSDIESKPSFNDFIIYAVSRALAAHKNINSLYVDGQVRAMSDVNVALAVNTDEGLLVPTIKNADKLSLGQIARETKKVIRLCKAHDLKDIDLETATFTVTNLGSFGVRNFTPVLNIPQTAILGVGEIELVPREENGEVVFAKVINLSLTLDHRAVDGVPGAQFLKTLKENLKDIDLLAAK